MDCANVATAQGKYRSLRILIVEDHEDTASTLAMVLRLNEYEEVRVAADGLAALHVAHALQPDVVLLDLGLPKLDGYQVAKQLRGQGATHNRPLIIAITGYGDKAARQRSREAGIDLHLVKPVGMDELQQVLERIQTVAMPGAERVVRNRHERRCRAGPLKEMSDRAQRESDCPKATAYRHNDASALD